MQIVPHEPRWAGEFEELAAVLAATLGSSAVGIEHVGSTSVPGLAARPILDIDVVIGGAEGFPEVARRLATLGYDHQGDLGVAGREAFGRVTSSVPFTKSGRTWMNHHLYVCVDGATELRRHRAFRDLLRRDPRAARAYEELKSDLAAKCGGDRARYTAGKTNFIEALLAHH